MSKWVKIGVVTVVAIIVLVTVFNLPINRLFSSLSRPVGVLMTRAGVETRQLIGNLTGGDTRQENQNLRTRLTQAQLQLVELDRLRKENEGLRRELSYAGSVDYDTVTTGIVNYQPDPGRSMLRINAGSADGIGVDMPVVSGGALVGVTRSVGKRTADVVLIGDTDFRALAIVSGRDAPGVIKGQIGDGVSMEQLPADDSVQAGDIVVTSGLDGVYPKGILIGSISSVSEAPGSVFMVAQIERSVNPSRLYALTVLLND